MKRRNLLLSVGGTALGGSALLGSGAFSRIESQRDVTIQVADDANAYLGLDKCDTPNGSYAHPDEKGHLAILMDDTNPTIDDTDLGYGVNSDSRTHFDRVFQICNNGKEAVCIHIEDDEQWPEYEGERRVDFYLEDDPTQSIVGVGNQFGLELGECVCIGIRTTTKTLTEGDRLLEALDETVTIVADVDCEPDEPPIEECLDCTEDGDAGRLQWLELRNTGDEKTIEVRQRRPSGPDATIFGPASVGTSETFSFDIFVTGPSDLYFFVDGDQIPIDHADDNHGDNLHVSCSETVQTTSPLHRDENEVGYELDIVAGRDRDGYCINGN